MWGGTPRHETNKTQNNRRKRGRALNELRRESSCEPEWTHEKLTGKEKGHQEKERMPSTALLELETLEKTTPNLARRVSRLELHGQAVANAARLEWKE